MSIYQEISDCLGLEKTLAAHIIALGKLKQKSEDPRLKELIKRAITEIQTAHVSMKKGKSTPFALGSGSANPNGWPHSTNLDVICRKLIPSKIPEWQVLARKAGWTPPAVTQKADERTPP